MEEVEGVQNYLKVEVVEEEVGEAIFQNKK